MRDESTVRIECAKLQNNIKLMTDDLTQTEAALDRLQATTASGRTRLINQERQKFENQKIAAKEHIKSICAKRLKGAEDLIDSFPGQEKREVAGKCEVESIETQLAEIYPQSLLDNYVCTSPIEFDSDSEAYSAYVYVERKVSKMSQGSFASTVFNGVTDMLISVCDGKLGGKAALIIIGLVSLSFIFAPFFFLALFVLLGFCAIVQGINANTVLRNLYSVKRYLNEAYDIEVFQQDKKGILDKVDDFLGGAAEEYIREIDAREFIMNPKILADFDAKAQRDEDRLRASITDKKQKLEQAQVDAGTLLAELDRIVEERETAAKTARSKYLEALDWKMEWLDTLLVDVTAENRIVGCKWTRGNSLYFAKDLMQLQNFELLTAYQTFLHMHPSYTRQAALDYKYMGGTMVPFSRLQPNIFELCTDSEAISKRVERIVNDLKARITNILQSCANIEAFNELMGTYDAPGECYVLIHLIGLSSISSELRTLLKNGPKVGYFFKIYLTMEELGELAADFPFDDVAEYCEVGDVVTPRTVGQLRRMLGIDA